MKITLLIVEDDKSLCSSLEKSFRRRDYDVICTSSVVEAMRLVKERNIMLVLLDIKLSDGSGIDVVTAAHNFDEEIIVIMITAFPEVNTAVRAMKEGAYDFIAKPFALEELHLIVQRALHARELRRTVRRLDYECRHSREEVTEILGDSPVIEFLRDQIRKVAKADIPVLITGETGTGKELVADAIHRLSLRCAGPLVKVNCGTFSEQLLESELFGHEKGAFTDAKEARPGLFEMADGGTLFLDEIAEMRPRLQTQFLRVIEGHKFRRVGGQREIQTSVRVIAATNRNLLERIQIGDFQKDLYFRLNVFQIQMPPLRSRGNDIILLAHFFLQRSTMVLRKRPTCLLPAVEENLLAYNWPGNIRELRNVMERAALLCETGEVGIEHLPIELQASTFVSRHVSKGSGGMPSLAEIERCYVTHVVENVGNNLSEAARILGIARNTLKAKLHLEDTSPNDP